MRNSGNLLGLVLQHQGAETGSIFPCSLPERDEGRGGSRGSHQKGGLGDLPPFLVVLCAGITLSTLLLLWTPLKWQLGFWSFLHLVVPNLPNWRYHRLARPRLDSKDPSLDPVASRVVTVVVFRFMC